MQKSITVIHEMTENDRIREAARMREKRLHDEASALSNAERRGEARGIDKGIAEMIKGMKLAGLTNEQINNVLKLSKEGNHNL